MEKPTVAQLDESLKDLVKNWKRFALHLPGIDLAKINIIEANKQDDVEEQKIALYDKWLKVYPDASWDDVAITLETVDENTIAKQLRDKYLTSSVKTKEDVLPLIKEVAQDPSISGSSTSSSESVPVSSEIEEVAIEEDVVTKLDSLEQSFCDLTYEVKSTVEAAEEKNGNIKNVIFHVQQARAFRINSLQSVKTTDELFEAIYPHYNFLNCHLIIRIALLLCNIIAKKAIEYKEEIAKFMKTTKVMQIKNVLRRYHQQRCPALSQSRCTLVEIKVENGWGDQPLWLVELLVKTLFPVKHPDELPWYDIVPGSVIMSFIAFEHMTPSLIENSSSRRNKWLMRLMRVISLKIGDELVWQRKDGDAVLSFEDSLIEATLANNIEAVQFILQYTQVDINTRNSTLIQIKSSDGFIPQDKIISTFRSFRVMFDTLVEDIEQVLQYVKPPSGGHPDHEFLKIQNLSEISPHLPKALSRRVEHYIQSLENFVKKRLTVPEFTEYFLAKYFPTPFPGCIEVILSLHSAVWSTCSVWYVEQLGQLIFTPTIFYQLQWFRNDGTEEGVCFLADRKMKDNLKECITKIKSRLSMLGVVSVQVDDTVTIVNDYSDGYTFHEAIELARTKGDDEIFAVLQQMQNPAKSHYEVGSIDDNGNCSFHLHPDSTPLMIACCIDNSQLVQLLLDHNADPNIQNGRGVTALMYSTGNTKIFQMLLDHGAEHANIVSIFNESVIHFACIAGNVKVVKKLLASESNDPLLNIKNSITGDTPLILASAYNHGAVVEVLLQAGVDPDIQNIEGYTALMEASKNGNKEIVEQLLLANADPDIRDNDQETAVHHTDNDEDIVDQLVKANANLSMFPAFLHLFLDDEDVFPDDDDAAKVKLEELKYQFSTSSESDKLGISLCVAIKVGAASLAKALIKQGISNPDISFWGITPLLTAIEEGYVELVQKLLQAQADPNMQDDDGRTPLMIAYDEQEGENQRTLIQMLLQANANPNVMDGEGNTVLTKACHDQDTEIVDILLEAKADPNILDFTEGNTPLVIACSKKAIEIVEKLLLAKANPNIENGEGKTPLMIACSNDDVEIVSILLQAGADPTIIDNEGNTALDYAEEDDIIMDMLLNSISTELNC